MVHVWLPLFVLKCVVVVCGAGHYITLYETLMLILCELVRQKFGHSSDSELDSVQNMI